MMNRNPQPSDCSGSAVAPGVPSRPNEERSPYHRNCPPWARGQELIEFALIVPLLLLVAFGVLDLGRIFHAAIAVTGAAREGARFAVLYGYDIDFDEDGDEIFTLYPDDIRATTAQEAQDAGISLNPDPGGNITVYAPDGTYGRNKPIGVRVIYTVPLVITSILPDAEIQLDRYAEMLVP